MSEDNDDDDGDVSVATVAKSLSFAMIKVESGNDVTFSWICCCQVVLDGAEVTVFPSIVVPIDDKEESFWGVWAYKIDCTFLFLVDP